MILTVDERLTLLGILPEKRNTADMRILRDLRMNLSYTEEERKRWGIPIGEIATSIVVDVLRKLDEQDDITEKILFVYEKFIPETE